MSFGRKRNKIEYYFYLQLIYLKQITASLYLAEVNKQGMVLIWQLHQKWFEFGLFSFPPREGEMRNAGKGNVKKNIDERGVYVPARRWQATGEHVWKRDVCKFIATFSCK